MRAASSVSVISNAPKTGALNRYRPMTSAQVSAIIANSTTAATKPSAGTTVRSNIPRGSFLSSIVPGLYDEAASRCTEMPLASSLHVADLLRWFCDFGAQCGERGLTVEALGLRLLIPGLFEPRGLRLYLGDELRARNDDRNSGVTQRLLADLVVLVPGLAGAARQSFARNLVDCGLIGVGDLLPLGFVHHQSEGDVVKAARNEGHMFDQRHELERIGGFLREEDAVGDALT